MPTPDEYQRSAHQRTRRATSARLGSLCGTCRKRPPGPGLRTCDWCVGKERRLEGLARQALWRECCGSCDEHRFDCTEVEPHKRGKGPFGPTRAPTAAELVAAFRSAS